MTGKGVPASRRVRASAGCSPWVGERNIPLPEARAMGVDDVPERGSPQLDYKQMEGLHR